MESGTSALSRREAVLVTASELAQSTHANVVLAVRASFDPAWSTSPRIEGAIDVWLDTELAAPSDPVAGSRPLPSAASLEANLRRWGVHQDSDIVLYDHEGGLLAARGWWLLRWAGAQRVRLLDGGFAAWTAAGLQTTTVAREARPGNFNVAPGGMPQLDALAAARLAREGLLLDSRIQPNYEGGESAPGEPARGHIPGAISVPAPANLDADGMFLDEAALKALYAAAGVDGATPVGVYCGAGVSAAHDIVALASIGIDAPMYVGSWSAWSSDPARPVARGPEPG